jgi:hypothetical protein
MTVAGIIMFDSTDLSQIPAGPAAAAGYVGGRWPTFHDLAARFPHALLLSIAISASEDADAIDVENGDATAPQVPAWHDRQRERGVLRPCVYASVSTMQAEVIPELRAAGINRPDVRLWSAHYAGLHICGPSTCGELGTDADGTQWTDRAYGRNLDQSLLVASFFTVTTSKPVPTPAPKPPARPAAEEDEMPSGVIQAPKGQREPHSWLTGTVSQIVLRADWQGVQETAPAVALRIARVNGTWDDTGTITVGVNEVYTVPEPATCNGCSFTREDSGVAQVAWHCNPAS